MPHSVDNITPWTVELACSRRQVWKGELWIARVVGITAKGRNIRRRVPVRYEGEGRTGRVVAAVSSPGVYETAAEQAILIFADGDSTPISVWDLTVELVKTPLASRAAWEQTRTAKPPATPTPLQQLVSELTGRPGPMTAADLETGAWTSTQRAALHIALGAQMLAEAGDIDEPLRTVVLDAVTHAVQLAGTPTAQRGPQAPG